MVKQLIGDKDFVEVFIDTPISVAEKRDPKGLYKKARSGEIPNFTGVSSPYEKPQAPQITLDTTKLSAKESVLKILDYLNK
jgi:bifunctional enzyme CysN/CysC